MIFGILIKIDVTAIILIKNISMLMYFGIPEHHQILMPFFQLLLTNEKTLERAYIFLNLDAGKDNLAVFMFVLPVAHDEDPRAKYNAISSFDFTSASVTPARVMPPFAVSRV